MIMKNNFNAKGKDRTRLIEQIMAKRAQLQMQILPLINCIQTSIYKR